MSRPCVYTYTHLDELLPIKMRRHQLTRMLEGLHAIERAAEPSNDDWRVCSDAVNILETLTTEKGGWWRGLDEQPVQVVDSSGLLKDAVAALAFAGARKLEGGQIRLDAAGIHAVRAVLEDYAALLEALPARTIIRAHRLTERRIQDILRGKRRAHDVEVMAL